MYHINLIYSVGLEVAYIVVGLGGLYCRMTIDAIQDCNYVFLQLTSSHNCFIIGVID
jgi:hypothetical protein